LVAAVGDYLDASALVLLVVAQPRQKDVLALVAQAQQPPFISMFAVAEASSALSKLVRTRTMSAENAIAALSDLDDWVAINARFVDVDPTDVHEANLLVRQFELKLRTPDAIHLAICRRLGARMVTLDNNLANAARAVDVAFINPAADGQADPQSDPKRKI
jgi:uncharacterized protein